MHPRPAVNHRLLVLLGSVAAAALLPLAGAAAGPVLDDTPAGPGRAGAENPETPENLANADNAMAGAANGETGAGVGSADAKAGARPAGDGSHGGGTAGSSGAGSAGPEEGEGQRHRASESGGLSPSSPLSSPPSSSLTSPSSPSRSQGTPGASGTLAAPDTLARCGPELSSPDGVEAQTCVLSQGADTWARTYYRNATGEDLTAVLSMMGPHGRTVQMHCVVGADDEPGACDTPKERTVGPAAHYTAVAEFATESGDALLLRSGSNSPGPQGS
ncbi:hypothetical protein [Streptomyces sp. CC224B]|uniref:hypothetical protein n=1 Tax=Streptomyces sp. CC224B TaxID=3044571 RepID=UPI0024A7C59B|nr:hypothetical protein [Streptomyces sp. CC224B]